MQTKGPEWFCKYSENLKQNIAFNKKTGWVYCDDGTEYSPDEYKILKKTGKPVPLQVHIIKKMFDGMLISLD